MDNNADVTRISKIPDRFRVLYQSPEIDSSVRVETLTSTKLCYTLVERVEDKLCRPAWLI